MSDTQSIAATNERMSQLVASFITLMQPMLIMLGKVTPGEREYIVRVIRQVVTNVDEKEAQREKEAHEKAQREKEAREKAQREKEAREKEAREKEAHEKAQREKAQRKEERAKAAAEALRAHNEKEAEKVTAFHNKMYTAAEIDYDDDETASDTRRVAKPRGTIVKNERRSKAQKERWAKRRAATAAAAAAAALLDFTGATVIEIESGTSEIDEDETVE